MTKEIKSNFPINSINFMLCRYFKLKLGVFRFKNKNQLKKDKFDLCFGILILFEILYMNVCSI